MTGKFRFSGDEREETTTIGLRLTVFSGPSFDAVWKMFILDGKRRDLRGLSPRLKMRGTIDVSLTAYIDKSELSRQQVSLWIQEGDRACLKRRFIRGIHYYNRALDLARTEGLADLEGRVCRDLAYVYLHHGSYRNALQLLERGLSLEVPHPELRLGLLINKISTLLAEKKYRPGLDVTNDAINYFLEKYPKLEGASFTMLSTYNALRNLRRDLKRVAELLQSGINQDRIQVDFQLSPPPWTPSE